MQYTIYKGLQKPLEFMGIRGRFLIYAAVLLGGSFLSFLLTSIFIGKLAAFILMLVMLIVGYLFIFFKQKEGLHNKRRNRGIYAYKTICLKN